MAKRIITCVVFSAFFSFVPLSAQQNDLTADVSRTDSSVTGTVTTDSGSSVSVTIGRGGTSRQTPESLPSQFGTVSLGMSVDAVKDALKKDGQFGYRGDRDVSLMPGENRVLIETDSSRYAPYSFLERCWFQFYEDKLYIMTINMDTDKLDHYSVFSKLCEKYGNPTSLNPEKSEWVSDTVIVALERPLSIKYTDRATFEKIQAGSLVDKSAAEKSRDQFLEGL